MHWQASWTSKPDWQSFCNQNWRVMRKFFSTATSSPKCTKSTCCTSWYTAIHPHRPLRFISAVRVFLSHNHLLVDKVIPFLDFRYSLPRRGCRSGFASTISNLDRAECIAVDSPLLWKLYMHDWFCLAGCKTEFWIDFFNFDGESTLQWNFCFIYCLIVFYNSFQGYVFSFMVVCWCYKLLGFGLLYW